MTASLLKFHPERIMSKKKIAGFLTLLGILAAALIYTISKKNQVVALEKKDGEVVPTAAEKASELYKKVADAAKETNSMLTDAQRKAIREELAQVDEEVQDEKSHYDKSLEKVQSLTKKFQDLSRQQEQLMQASSPDTERLDKINALKNQVRDQVLKANEDLAIDYKTYARRYAEVAVEQMSVQKED